MISNPFLNANIAKIFELTKNIRKNYQKNLFFI